MGSLMDLAKKVKLAQEFEELTNKLTEYGAKYELATADRAKYTESQLTELVQIGPLGEQVTRESIIAAQENDAKTVIIDTKIKLENIQTQVVEDTVAFTTDDADEVTAKIAETSTKMFDLKIIVTPKEEPVVIEQKL